MEIERIVDGQKRKFTLTSDELWQVYFEKEAEFDMYDVIEAVRVMDDEDRLALEHSLGMDVDDFLADEAAISQLAKDMRARMDKQDIEKETAFWQAVKMNEEKRNEEINIDRANDSVEHWQSFVGHTISNPAAELIFHSYDNGQFTVRHCCGNPEDYIESKGTPEEIAKQHHFDDDFREKFFDMDYRMEPDSVEHAQKEATIDWSKVPVDTPISISPDGEHWYRNHFAKYENGEVYFWRDGRTSYTEGEYNDMYFSQAVACNYAKLNENDLQKMQAAISGETDMEDEAEFVKLSMEQLNELSYKDQFKVVLAMEFPETMGNEKLQEDLYENFMASDEVGFFSSDFRAAIEKEMEQLSNQELKCENSDGIFI